MGEANLNPAALRDLYEALRAMTDSARLSTEPHIEYAVYRRLPVRHGIAQSKLRSGTRKSKPLAPLYGRQPPMTEWQDIANPLFMSVSELQRSNRRASAIELERRNRLSAVLLPPTKDKP